jgi:hypothetical protein
MSAEKQTAADELRTAAQVERAGWGGLQGRIPPQVTVHLALAELLEQIAWSWDLDPALEHRHGGPEILLVAQAINRCVN